MVSPVNLCVYCKGGKNLCGNKTCPLLKRFEVVPKVRESVSTEFFGPNYSVFVGRAGYPNVGIGPMAALEERPNLDSPKDWLGMDYQKIVELRSLLIRSRQDENVFSRSRFVEENQELAMSSRPTDIELTFRKKPVYRVSFSDIVQPMGPSAPLQKLRLAQNPKIPKRVEYIVNDELRAAEAARMLYKSGQDVYKITTILSSGVLGAGEAKKLVPTRWSITAVDDMIAKQMMEGIRTYPQINDFLVFESRHLDNHFVTLFMPGNWEFENFEAWAPGSSWSFSLKKTEIIEEYEPFEGRTKYADKQGGGYYASRISAVKALYRMRRQARVVVFREVYEGYVIPLGVWVVRQTSEKAYENPPKRFATQKEALEYVRTRIRVPLEEYLRQSRMLRQKRLEDFIRPKAV